MEKTIKEPNVEEGCVRIEGFRDLKMPILPKSLTLEEKKFLLAVERGDLANVKRIIQRARRHNHINLNCMDPLGRGALLMAIDNENLQMVELLVVMGIETRDALLHAIDKEFVEAVELLLEHEELIHKDGDKYSWEKVDRTLASFTPDITPLILAAHRNNYEILKILLDRGATLPMPHDVRCGCVDCIRGVQEDSLRHSMSRINAYRALASPSLIALSSIDPILTAFELSLELKNLAYAETEFRQEYMDLRKQCQEFAVELLSHTRSSQELAILLNHDPNSTPYEDGEQMKLARLELAIDYKQKKFVAHPNIQQLLGAIWYEGLPGFRRKSFLQKGLEICQIAALFPFYCLLYILAPATQYGQLMRKPFMKFLIHASSYLFFLLLLILVSQRFEVLVIQLFGSESMQRSLNDQLKRQRGNGPTFLECVVAVYVLGYICEDMKEMWKEGLVRYVRNMWNFIDMSRNVAYSLVMILRAVAYYQQKQEILDDPSTAYIPREEWDAFDPQLIAEGIFSMANIFSALKLVHLFSINPYLGPLQISLGRMVIDIVKFFFIYSLVLFAFACGLNQLLWYFSDLEKQKCYSLPGGLPDWNKNPEACLKWRRFANLFESSQSLFWASFGLMDLTNFELSGIKSYTRFWGLLMFGSYSVINVVVLLNLLIAMMSNSYSLITEHSDTEWKFARSKLWMSYFELGNTLPPPFNLIPTPKDILKTLGLRPKDKLRRMSTKRRNHHLRERDYRYASVMRSLVWRYVTTMHRRQDLSEVTEDDVNEVKGDISTLRFELLEIFKNNGMDISSANKNTKAALGRKMRVWERRLLRDFHVVSVAGEEGSEEKEKTNQSDDETNPADKFRRLAMMVVNSNATKAARSSNRQIKPMCQIGRSLSNDSFKSSQNLRKAMEEAQRLAVMEPTPENSPRSSPLPLPPDTGTSVLELLQNIAEEERQELGEDSLFNSLQLNIKGSAIPWKPAINADINKKDIPPYLSRVINTKPQITSAGNKAISHVTAKSINEPRINEEQKRKSSSDHRFSHVKQSPAELDNKIHSQESENQNKTTYSKVDEKNRQELRSDTKPQIATKFESKTDIKSLELNQKNNGNAKLQDTKASSYKNEIKPETVGTKSESQSVIKEENEIQREPSQMKTELKPTIEKVTDQPCSAFEMQTESIDSDVKRKSINELPSTSKEKTESTTMGLDKKRNMKGESNDMKSEMEDLSTKAKEKKNETAFKSDQSQTRLQMEMETKPCRTQCESKQRNQSQTKSDEAALINKESIVNQADSTITVKTEMESFSVVDNISSFIDIQSKSSSAVIEEADQNLISSECPMIKEIKINVDADPLVRVPTDLQLQTDKCQDINVEKSNAHVKRRAPMKPDEKNKTFISKEDLNQSVFNLGSDCAKPDSLNKLDTLQTVRNPVHIQGSTDGNLTENEQSLTKDGVLQVLQENTKCDNVTKSMDVNLISEEKDDSFGKSMPVTPSIDDSSLKLVQQPSTTIMKTGPSVRESDKQDPKLSLSTNATQEQDNNGDLTKPSVIIHSTPPPVVIQTGICKDDKRKGTEQLTVTESEIRSTPPPIVIQAGIRRETERKIVEKRTTSSTEPAVASVAIATQPEIRNEDEHKGTEQPNINESVKHSTSSSVIIQVGLPEKDRRKGTELVMSSTSAVIQAGLRKDDEHKESEPAAYLTTTPVVIQAGLCKDDERKEPEPVTHLTSAPVVIQAGLHKDDERSGTQQLLNVTPAASTTSSNPNSTYNSIANVKTIKREPRSGWL